jgi:Domain of unknown function (DUF6766)
MPKYLRDNALTLAMLGLFVPALAGQFLAGWSVYNDERGEHGSEPVSALEYVTSPHFGEAVFENWESEFLQMGIFVLLTARLRQKGSPESKPFEDGEGHPPESDREPDPGRKGAPWPVRAGGTIAKVYSHSLSLALFALFALSFSLHVVTGAAEYSADQLEHGGQAVSALQYLGTSQLWFESFQNWQSEFMSIAALVVLAIFLRERGSSQSKPVDAPHGQTGD